MAEPAYTGTGTGQAAEKHQGREAAECSYLSRPLENPPQPPQLRADQNSHPHTPRDETNNTAITELFQIGCRRKNGTGTK